LYFEFDQAQVDVNVHPTKHEVRFLHARLIHDFISQTLMKVLLATDCAPPHYDPTNKPSDERQGQAIASRYVQDYKSIEPRLLGALLDNNERQHTEGNVAAIGDTALWDTSASGTSPLDNATADILWPPCNPGMLGAQKCPEAQQSQNAHNAHNSWYPLLGGYEQLGNADFNSILRRTQGFLFLDYYLLSMQDSYIIINMKTARVLDKNNKNNHYKSKPLLLPIVFQHHLFSQEDRQLLTQQGFEFAYNIKQQSMITHLPVPHLQNWQAVCYRKIAPDTISRVLSLLFNRLFESVVE